VWAARQGDGPLRALGPDELDAEADRLSATARHLRARARAMRRHAARAGERAEADRLRALGVSPNPRSAATREEMRGAFRRLGPGWHTSTSLAAEAGIVGCGTRHATLRALAALGEAAHNGRTTKGSRWRWTAYPEPPPCPPEGPDRAARPLAVELVGAALAGMPAGWHSRAAVEAAADGLSRTSVLRALRALVASGRAVHNGSPHRARLYALPGTPPEPQGPEEDRPRRPAPRRPVPPLSGRERRARAAERRLRARPRGPTVDDRVREALAEGSCGPAELGRRLARKGEPPGREALERALVRMVATGSVLRRNNRDHAVGAERLLYEARRDPRKAQIGQEQGVAVRSASACTTGGAV
jgi:hypothetical protein